MKRFLLVAINAKYIHTGLAVRSLFTYAENYKKHCLAMVEFTINQRVDFMLEELFLRQPDVLFISCYIWNIAMVRLLCPAIKKLLPACAIVLGGPEVSFDANAVLSENPAVDMIIRGEGEETFSALLDHFSLGSSPLRSIPRLTLRENNTILSTPDAPPLDLSKLLFPYPDLDIQTGQIFYYETSRGCPYRCAYCLSSVEKNVRDVPLEIVLPDLQRFLDARVRQVKFVDRTFNCNKARTMKIWSFLKAHDNGLTNFHFELSADLLDFEMITFLRDLRIGFFQFEIGVQSTNADTLESICRVSHFDRLANSVRMIASYNNIHQHLDLIAGLPKEDFSCFSHSFDAVYALHPQQLQLGFLKLLKGSPLQNDAVGFGLVARDDPPYEVLSTPWLPHREVLRLKHIEEMVELYYNSGRFSSCMEYFTALHEGPFACYQALAEFWVLGEFHRHSLGKLEQLDVLHAFAQTLPLCNENRFAALAKLDLCLHEKPKKFPTWLSATPGPQLRAQILNFYRDDKNIEAYLPQYRAWDPHDIARMTHIDVFQQEHIPCVLLFTYDTRDVWGHAHSIEIHL